MRKLAVLPAESPASAASDQLIGQCPSMQELYKGIGRVAAQEVKGVGPLGLLAGIPAALQQLNPEIALIGGISLLILFGLPMLPVPGIRRVPVQLVVLTAAIGIGMAVDLEHKHTYLFPAEFFGLPMISEIVRSKANIDNGSHTRNANMFHGLFLLAFVLLLPSLIHQIPLAALGAMLVYTRFRLASPKEFIHTLRIGPEQLVVFVGTILATDLLLGIAAGIALEVMFHLWHGTPFSALFRPDVEIVEDPNTRVLVLLVKRACVFSNWLAVRNSIVRQLESVDEITVDLSEACFVDHSVLSKLHDLSREFSADGKRLVVAGLENHRAFSTHPQAARKQLRPATSDSSGIVV